ncbi:MAG: hypothetical protein GY715_06195 [Planctomycetes bacterium]|nr:hypothetical protein [Planctomycetota bacterium]
MIERMTAVVGGLWVATAAIGAPEAAYHTHAELTAWVDRLDAEHGRSCVAETIGTSHEGRAIRALRVALPGGLEPDERPALLLVANVDGAHLAGSEVAMTVAEELLRLARDGEPEEQADAVASFLTSHTLYVVPRANPDAAERFFAAVKDERRRTLRPDDRDRDGAIDEDPPNDLNGDGLITMMRVPDPKKADHMADAEEPRLSVLPERDKGERTEFVLYVEGIDDDGDGEVNEDPVGGVDLDMNFMHGYREHADGAGLHQVSEPESLALLRYVLDHQNIAIVLTYGRHDNLSKPPDGKGTYPSGTPKNIDEKDVGLYTEMSRRFTEITGLKKVPSVPDEGAFFAWAYAQFGVPSFTTPLWTRPEPEKKEEEEGGDGGDGGDAPEADAGDEGLTPSGVGDISMETLAELRANAEAQGMEVTDEMIASLTPQMVEGFAKRAGVEIRRVESGAGAESEPGKAKNADEAAWLTYSDDVRDGAGFVDWEPFEHPDLGPVEIGGWTPYFKTNPPPDELAAIAETQVAFVLELARLFPDVSLSEPEVTRLASGLYEMEVALVNDGYLPTGTAMAQRNRRARPYVVRLDVTNEQILTGQRVHKVWSVAGSGGRHEYRWIIRADDDSDLTITVYSEKFGGFDRTVRLRDTGGKGGTR